MSRRQKQDASIGTSARASARIGTGFGEVKAKFVKRP
jgi:hypothetical protein